MDNENVRRQVCSQFYCPRESRSLNSACLNPAMCPFVHRRESNSAFATFSPLDDPNQIEPAAPACRARPIPPYLCVDYLLGQCHGGNETGAEEARIVQCACGLHPSWAELSNSEVFLNRLATAFIMLTHRQLARVPMQAASSPVTLASVTDHQCGICLDSILGSGRYYGLLENCAHHFCINCIVVWTNRNPASGCPTCRQLSSRIQVWPTLVEEQVDRRRIFDLEQLCADLSTTNRAGPATQTQRVVRTISRQYLENRMRELFREDDLLRATASVVDFARRQALGDELAR